MADINKIWDRVQKMVRLGNNEGATEAERETALRMAYKVLAQHNLSMADMPAESNGEDRVRQEITISADKWARQVCQQVAKLFFCNYFFCRTASAGRDMHCFIGLQSNAVTALTMAEFLVKSIKREASKRYSSPTSPHGRSFCVGTTNAIYHRVTEMVKETVEESDAVPGTAVAIIKLRTKEEDANDSWMKEMGMTTKVAKARHDNSLRASAYFDGKSYGKTISLNTQVTSKPARAQLQ